MMGNDLFNAILAMDAYNRGYNFGLSVSGAQLGYATISQDSSILRDPDGARLDQPASCSRIWSDLFPVACRTTSFSDVTARTT